MRGSITIATLFGTKVRMHLTFLILLVWVAAGEALTRGTQAAVIGVLFVLLLFACVVAHEFGHVLMARRYGGQTEDILLLPIGGISRMERIPESPREELAVALAGPAVSIAIGAALMLLFGAPSKSSIDSLTLGALLQRLAATNFLLALFNLVPAFPMDGGRALRALLALRLGRMGATKLAARLGHVIAVAFALLGLVSGNPIIVLIAIFIYFGASAEAADTELRDLARVLTVADVMRRNVRSISSGAPLSEGIELMLQAGQHAIPVVDRSGKYLGVATKDGIIRALHQADADPAIDEAVERNMPTVSAHERLSKAMEAMQGRTAPAVLVIGARGELLGMITPETLADLMLVHAVPKARAPIMRMAHSTVSVPRSA